MTIWWNILTFAITFILWWSFWKFYCFSWECKYILNFRPPVISSSSVPYHLMFWFCAIYWTNLCHLIRLIWAKKYNTPTLIVLSEILPGGTEGASSQGGSLLKTTILCMYNWPVNDSWARLLVLVGQTGATMLHTFPFFCGCACGCVHVGVCMWACPCGCVHVGVCMHVYHSEANMTKTSWLDWEEVVRTERRLGSLDKWAKRRSSILLKSTQREKNKLTHA